jgi:hypothetical protein
MRQKYIRRTVFVVGMFLFVSIPTTSAGLDVEYYKLPAWPVTSIFFDQDDLIQLEFTHEWASSAWSSSGRTVDVTKLAFGQEPITVQEILFASKLLKQGKVAAVDGTSNQHFLYLLADHPLTFKGRTQNQHCNISYIRRYKPAGVLLGFQIPIVRRENKIKLKSKISEELREELRKADQQIKFYDMYDDLEDFLEDILAKKNIEWDKKEDEIGLGDIITFVNFEIRSRHCERCVVGASVQFPSSRIRDIHALWDPELGNEGYTLFSIYGSLLFKKSQFFNPHVFAEFTVSPRARVDRRVPELKTYNAVKPVPGDKVPNDFSIFGDQIKFTTTTFKDIPDTTIRRFSTKTKRIKISRGEEFSFIFGNIFEKLFWKRAFLDIFYDFMTKGKDYLRKRVEDDPFDGKTLSTNSWQVAHKIGTQFNYQFDDHWRILGDFLYTFAGRNVEKAYQFGIAVNAEF